MRLGVRACDQASGGRCLATELPNDETHNGNLFETKTDCLYCYHCFTCGLCGYFPLRIKIGLFLVCIR